jgi:hypothetical protein
LVLQRITAYGSYFEKPPHKLNQSCSGCRRRTLCPCRGSLTLRIGRTRAVYKLRMGIALLLEVTWPVLDAWSGPSSLNWDSLPPHCCEGGFRASSDNRCPCCAYKEITIILCYAQIRSARKSFSIYGKECLSCSNWNCILRIRQQETTADFRQNPYPAGSSGFVVSARQNTL